MQRIDQREGGFLQQDCSLDLFASLLLQSTLFKAYGSEQVVGTCVFTFDFSGSIRDAIWLLHTVN